MAFRSGKAKPGLLASSNTLPRLDHFGPCSCIKSARLDFRHVRGTSERTSPASALIQGMSGPIAKVTIAASAARPPTAEARRRLLCRRRSSQNAGPPQNNQSNDYDGQYAAGPIGYLLVVLCHGRDLQCTPQSRVGDDSSAPRKCP